MIEALELRKHFGPVRAVDGLSFRVARGEVYGLIGPNGAGKTTTLRMVAGLTQPTSGHIVVGDSSPRDDSLELRGKVGYVTGSTGLYARLSAREFLQYFGRLHGLSQERIGARLTEVIRQFGLEEFIDRRCGALSTGERQRVSLSRAVLHDPQVLILDEPTAGLDVLASRFALNFVKMARQQGRTVLFSTHYLTEAELLCDRVGLIYSGTMLLEAPPAEIKSRFGTETLEGALLALVEQRRSQQPQPGLQ